jgi:hypothetical protein
MDLIHVTRRKWCTKYTGLCRTLTAFACLAFLACGELEQSRDDGLTGSPGYDAGSGYACTECVADSQCMRGMLCMGTKDGGADAGSFCLYRQAGLPGASCAAVDPFTASEAGWTSVDGVREVVCRQPKLNCTEYVNSVWD